MTEKQFEVGNLKIQDTAPKGRVYLLDMQGGVNALCSLINGLNDKSNRLEKENEQLKTQIKIFEKFLNENNLDIDWEIFCTVDECKKDSDDYGCKECKYLGVMWND